MALSQQRHGRRRHPVAAPVYRHQPDLEVPCHELAEHGLGEQTAYELITSELLLDGQARLNLATFVTTWMPSVAAQLIYVSGRAGSRENTALVRSNTGDSASHSGGAAASVKPGTKHQAQDRA